METPILELLAKTIGFITIFKTLISIIRWVWVHFLRPPKNLKEYGSWALVTGSTDGIGKALAFELASKGLHLILVGRNPARLSVTTKELHQRYLGSGLQVRSIVIDFSTDPLEVICSRIQEGIDGLDVGILINNAGMTNTWPRFFHEADSIMDDIVRVNLEGMCRVTRVVLPVMLKKKRGAIINIGSGSADTLPSFPLYSVYSSTKAYIHQFSRNLHVEYKQHGIDVQCQIPEFVKTKMLPFRFSSFFIPTPEVYSRACLRWIGYEPVCYPYWRHSLQRTLAQAMPKEFLDWAALQLVLHLRERENSKSQKKKPSREFHLSYLLMGLN
ncbi:hypothetical protein MRB53_016264 [Persea americana]|uniref:Uncharacterized protein n=1 Tax=Persea americana TaxID=3435 RepID=A0ACC2M1R4_PERAE|nr:hypothetical protein MRB53_016264 [Persea americana]